ncbi:MAG: hypothetical protein Q4G70_00450 [Pseudomonadota bacterium]|nr:hypothetical protein [Pseudomonadota bacterium]
MRTLTITQSTDWRTGLRAAGRAAAARRYTVESLNFETPAQLFSHMTEKRWQLIQLAQGKGELAVRELARLAGRDVKRVLPVRAGDCRFHAASGVIRRAEPRSDSAACVYSIAQRRNRCAVPTYEVLI